MKNNSIRILLLSAGTNACYHTAKTLKNNFNNFYIIGTDINDSFLIPTINYLDKFYKVPLATDQNYYSKIIRICKTERVDYIIPSLDIDLKYFYRENIDLKRMGIISLGISKRTSKFCSDKKTIFNVLEKHNLPIPKILNLSEIKNHEMYFIKPIDGYGSKNAMLVKGNELSKISDDDKYIIQECCHSPEITLECFYYDGELKTVARERIETKSGVCTKAKIIYESKLTYIAKKMISIIDCPHCFNLQFMVNDDGAFVITDVNFRLAGGMGLSYACGWDEISALAKVMMHKEKKDILSTLPSNLPPQYVIRTYSDIVTKILKQIIALDFDGTIVDSRKRHIKVLNDSLKKYNLHLNISDYLRCKRNGMNTYDYLIYKKVSRSLSRLIYRFWVKNIEKNKYLKYDTIYDYTCEMIKNLSKDYDLILITARNNKEGFFNQIKRFGLLGKFKDIYIVKSDLNTTKEKANILIQNNPIYMIGDTYSDAVAAKVAGVSFKHMNKGFHDYKYVKEQLDA